MVGCWAHVRRKFDEALQTLPKEKQQGSLAAVGECYCTKLFQLEETLSELTAEERYTKRLELEKPVLDALLAWAEDASVKTAPKSALGKALHYTIMVRGCQSYLFFERSANLTGNNIGRWFVERK